MPGTSARKPGYTWVHEPMTERRAKPPMPTTSPTYRPGVVIGGKYRIEGPLAEGGIGVIVSAQHIGLGRRVAIKYLKPKVISDATVVERFEREGRLVARLRSEHVVRVHDVGELPGAGPYMVMEYLEGRDLGSVVGDGPLPLARAVDYVLQACDAMAEAHSVGIVHRDLKPENLFLASRPGDEPIVKVLDFGISKLTPRAGDRGREPSATESGETFGTPVYMSPEQLHSSANVDARTDVWALGVILFELVTGRMPFEGDTLPQLCSSIIGCEPMRLRDLRRDAPEGLEAIVLRCLRKDREERYPNVAELAGDLEPFGLPGGAERTGRMKRLLRAAGETVKSAPPPSETLPPPEPPAMPELPATPSTTDAKSATYQQTATEEPSEPSEPDEERALPVVAPGIWRARWALVAFAALVATAALIALATRRPTVAAPTTAATIAPTAPSMTATAAAAASVDTTVPVELPPPPPLSAAASAPAAAPSHSLRPAPTRASPSAGDDYSQFGGRK
jgi:serine/threonine protein kinase